jgi:hypothetical protein
LRNPLIGERSADSKMTPRANFVRVENSNRSKSKPPGEDPLTSRLGSRPETMDDRQSRDVARPLVAR